MKSGPGFLKREAYSPVNRQGFSNLFTANDSKSYSGNWFRAFAEYCCGSGFISTIKQSLNNGLRGGFAFVAGISASDITLVLISNVFTQLFAELKELKIEIGIAGCFFLVTMGVYFVFFKKSAGKRGRQTDCNKISQKRLCEDFCFRVFNEFFKPGLHFILDNLVYRICSLSY